MFRKSALAMAMLGAFASTNVVALGLGEIELKSALNQPLNAEVELLSATASELQELKVAVASAQAFADAGIERPVFLNKLQFNVSRNADGQPVIRITSRDVVREPFLDFLLEMSWSKGRLVREYTVLVDPPVTMPAPAPVAQAPVRSRAPVTAAPAQRVTHTAQMPRVSMSPGEYGPTKRNDTLWSIAEKVRPDTGVSVEQTMLGLLRANPEAFIDNNINNLKAGYVLRVPDRETLTAVSHREAVRETRAQYAAWRAGNNVAASAPADTASQGAAPVSVNTAPAGEPSLELVAPDATAEGGAKGEKTLQTVQRDLILANEALEEQRRQSEEMSGRLSMLEEQIANMQRLIQLKDNELARLQSQAASDPEAAEPMESAAEPMDAEALTPETPAEAGAAVADSVAGLPETPEGTLPADAMDGVAADSETASPDVDPLEQPTGEMALPEGAETGKPESAGMAPEGEGAEAAVSEPAAVATPAPPVAPETATNPGFVERLLANPLYLGAGAAVLLLLGFLGLRRKRSVETEFQESILQAAQSSARASDSEITGAETESTEPKAAHSSLLSEFAVSDMGSIRNDGEADPLAEADVYLAYGRYQQAQDLIKDALENSPEDENLNLKLLEVYLAARNAPAFDEHAQTMLGWLDRGNTSTWEKVAEMGLELNPDNPLYQDGVAPTAGSEAPAASSDTLEADDGLDFDTDLSFDEAADALPDAELPTAEAPDEAQPDIEKGMDLDMDELNVDAGLDKDQPLEFDLGDFDFESVDSAEGAEEEMQGDGELADLDEVSTKLDLARAYIDMGDPDGARSILDEVMEEGSDNQKQEARGILGQLS